MDIRQDASDGYGAPFFCGPPVAIAIRDRRGAVIGHPLHHPIACTAWAALPHPYGGCTITHRPSGLSAGRWFPSPPLAALAARTLDRLGNWRDDVPSHIAAAARGLLLDMETAGLCRRESPHVEQQPYGAQDQKCDHNGQAVPDHV